MRRQHGVTVAFSVIVFATPAWAAPWDQPAAFAAQLISQGYQAAPALMLGMIMLCAIPLMALVARVLDWVMTPEALMRHDNRTWRGDTSLADDAENAPGHACVELLDAGDKRFSILRDMFRIGREDDNDIRISSNGVHRYHAAIHRQEFGDYYITDLSGLDGNGLLVNGQRCGDAHLHDGDIIDLGGGRIRFRAGFV